MSSELIPLFSTPVYKAQVQIPKLEVLGTLKYEDYPDKTGASSENTVILLSKAFRDLRDQIEQHLNTYVFDVLKSAQGKIKHTQSWINLHRPGDYAPKHYHCNSMYSGIVYLKVPENGGGLIFSNNPGAMQQLSPTTTEGNLFNSNRWGFPVTDGDIFIFPSHLTHSTEVNESNEDRYCLAFNYFLEGILGQDTAQVNLRIKS